MSENPARGTRPCQGDRLSAGRLDVMTHRVPLLHILVLTGPVAEGEKHGFNW